MDQIMNMQNQNQSSLLKPFHTETIDFNSTGKSTLMRSVTCEEAWLKELRNQMEIGDDEKMVSDDDLNMFSGQTGPMRFQ
jgi:hypothetical protein